MPEHKSSPSCLSVCLQTNLINNRPLQLPDCGDDMLTRTVIANFGVCLIAGGWFSVAVFAAGDDDPPSREVGNKAEGELFKQLISTDHQADALKKVLATPENHTSIILYVAATRAMAAKRIEDGLFLYYAGGLRAGFDRECFPPKGTGSEDPNVLNSAMRVESSYAVLPAIPQHPEVLPSVVQRLQKWVPQVADAYSPGYDYLRRNPDSEVRAVWQPVKAEFVMLLGEQSALANDKDYATANNFVNEFEEMHVTEYIKNGKYPADPQYIQTLETRRKARYRLQELKLIRSEDELPQKESSLTAAIKSGDPGLFRRLLVAGADPNEFNSRGESAVHVAAAESDAFWLNEVLAYGGDPNGLTWPFQRSADNDGNTPLLYAITARSNLIPDLDLPSGHLKNVTILLRAGADINEANYHGQPPCIAAVGSRNYEILVMLLHAGANPTARGLFGGSLPTILARIEDWRIPQSQFRFCREARSWLVNHGHLKNDFSSPEKPNLILGMLQVNGTYVLDPTGDKTLIGAMVTDNKDVYRKLLNSGIDPNQRDSKGTSVMQVAARKDDVFWLREAIKHGGNPNYVDETSMYNARPPLFAAIFANQRENVVELLKAGAKPDPVVQDTRFVPLSEVATTGRYDMVVDLLEAGANANRANRNGIPLVQWLREHTENDVGHDSQIPFFRKAKDILMKQGLLKK